MKKQLIALLLVVALLSSLCLAACNTVVVLDSYVFSKDGQAVYDDFVLPRYLGDDASPTKVKWTSDNAAIKLTEREDDYLAEIVFPETKQIVKLTVTAGKEQKEFTVIVNPLAPSDFARAYVFPQLRSKVSVDFTLDQTVTYKGKTATISWEVATGSPYIEVGENGTKCIVDHQGKTTEVSLRATFTYGTGANNTSTRTYNFTATREFSHQEAMHRWHTIAPMDQDLPISGYIVAIAEEYSSYGNATFYMVDEDFCSGYYIYRVKADATNGAKIAVGNYVTITGTKNKEYNGLFETDAGGTCIADDTKTIDVSEHIYAYDNDLFAEAPTADYHVSDYVSLTNWEVKSIASSPNLSSSPATVMTITKNGVDVTLNLTKYMAHHYSMNANDQTVKDVLAFCGTVAAGDYVTVSGVMGKYKGAYQLNLVQASDLKKTSADAEGTVYAGMEVKETVAAVKTAIAGNKLEELITANKTVTMPAGSDKISVVYSKFTDSNAVAINENVITVTPGKSEDVYVKATITYDKDGDNEYTTYVIFNIASEKMTDADMVAAEKKSLTVADFEKKGSIDLPTKGEKYEAVSISWELATTTLATLEDNKLTVAELPEEAGTITLTATLSCNGESTTKEITVNLAAAPKITITKVAIADLQENTAYKLVIDIIQPTEKQMYCLAEEWSNSMKLTEDITAAPDIYVKKVGDKFQLYFKDGSTDKYISITESQKNASDITKGYYHNLKIGVADATPAEFTIAENCIKINRPDHNASGEIEVELYIGTYYNASQSSTKEGLALSATSYLSQSTNYAAYLATVTEG